MRIGLLTLALAHNYGAILQNFALQTILRRLGHTPITIHYYRGSINNYIKIWLKFIIKCLIRHPNRKYKPFTLYSHIYGRFDGVYKFCKLHIAETRPFFGLDSKAKSLDEFDAYIVGSDQVWRPVITWNIYNMYLDFVQYNDYVKKIAYAASFGVDNWEYNDEQTDKCKELIKKFDAISVREASGINLCRDYLNVDAQHVLDPTMLLSADDYCKLIENSGEKYNYNGEVCVYILDMTPQKETLIQNFCNKNNLSWYRVGAPYENGDVPSIESWLAGFDKAKYVITDSFHGSVFSIIFKKPFVSIGNDARGMSRFHSLLRLFNLDERLIPETEIIDEITEPNWEEVNKVLTKWKIDSINFLIDALK